MPMPGEMYAMANGYDPHTMKKVIKDKAPKDNVPKCCKCGKTVNEAKSLHRINEKGVSVKWHCNNCFDGKIPEIVKDLTDI